MAGEKRRAGSPLPDLVDRGEVPFAQKVLINAGLQTSFPSGRPFGIMPWKRAPLRHFESIPEVAPRGALVKISFASAYLRNGFGGHRADVGVAPHLSPRRRAPVSREGSANSLGSGSDSDSGERKATIFMRPEAEMIFTRKKKNRSFGNLQSARYSPLRELDQHLFHHFELAGRVEMLGEDVDEGDVDGIRVGDAVIVLPFQGQRSEYTDCVCVPDLDYLVRLPDDFPLREEAVVILGGARMALSMVKRLKEVVMRNYSNCASPKVLVVGDKSLLLWFLHLMPMSFAPAEDEEDEEKGSPEFTIATASESLLRAKNKYPRIRFVQWNDDAYQAVLVERTKDCCRGEANVLVSLDATAKMLRTALSCLATNGRVLISSESTSILPSYIHRALEKSELELLYATDEVQDSHESCQELISLVKSGVVSLPPWTSFSSKDSMKIRKLEQMGQLPGSAVINFVANDD